MTRPPRSRNPELAIEETRTKKEKAIKDQKFEEAASMRDEEKKAKENLEASSPSGRKKRRRPRQG
ncbi:MAG: hypothetical protein Ct9H300mP32_2560 [Verrucomicrobiota bacterium]|nr:MAG: hypothetical protein Ct9H300mP32_2560 [Verrucomicrobiota bacterium]